MTAGLETIAIRQPAGVAATVIGKLGRPLAAPSANLSGRLSTTRAEDAAAQFDDDNLLILDDGPSPVGVESTIIGLTGDAALLLRPGGVTAEAVGDVLGTRPLQPAPGGTVTAPGMLESHYAPASPVRPDANSVRAGEALLAFGPAPVAGAEHALAIRNLSPAGDLREAAAALFCALAELDRLCPAAIAVAPIPRTGLGAAINDRLARAAAPGPAA